MTPEEIGTILSLVVIILILLGMYAILNNMYRDP